MICNKLKPNFPSNYSGKCDYYLSHQSILGGRGKALPAAYMPISQAQVKKKEEEKKVSNGN